MLSFQLCLPLRRDLRSKIPAAQQQCGATVLDEEAIQLRVVGVERDGLLLLARQGFVDHALAAAGAGAGAGAGSGGGGGANADKNRRGHSASAANATGSSHLSGSAANEHDREQQPSQPASLVTYIDLYDTVRGDLQNMYHVAFTFHLLDTWKRAGAGFLGVLFLPPSSFLLTHCAHRYRHETKMNCVGCSMNGDRTLIGFTRLERRMRTQSIAPSSPSVPISAGSASLVAATPPASSLLASHGLAAAIGSPSSPATPLSANSLSTSSLPLPSANVSGAAAVSSSEDVAAAAAATAAAMEGACVRRSQSFRRSKEKTILNAIRRRARVAASVQQYDSFVCSINPQGTLYRIGVDHRHLPQQLQFIASPAGWSQLLFFSGTELGRADATPLPSIDGRHFPLIDAGSVCVQCVCMSCRWPRAAHRRRSCCVCCRCTIFSAPLPGTSGTLGCSVSTCWRPLAAASRPSAVSTRFDATPSSRRR